MSRREAAAPVFTLNLRSIPPGAALPTVIRGDPHHFPGLRSLIYQAVIASELPANGVAIVISPMIAALLEVACSGGLWDGRDELVPFPPSPGVDLPRRVFLWRNLSVYVDTTMPDWRGYVAPHPGSTRSRDFRVDGP